MKTFVLRALSILVLAGMIVGVILILHNSYASGNGYYDYSTKIETEAEYESFVSIIQTGGGLNYIKTFPISYFEGVKTLADIPATAPTLPMTISWAVYTDKTLPIGLPYKGDNSDRYIQTMMVVLFGIGIGGILWLLPDGLSEKPKIVAKSQKATR